MSSQRSNNRNWIILDWNVRGLNDADKQRAVRAKIEEGNCSIFSIQETKKEAIDCSFMKKIVPKCFTKFAFLPSVGATGGILLGWNESLFKGKILFNTCHGERRDQFAQWLYDLQIRSDEDWMIIGDFQFLQSP
jgi:hypothetical protein